MAKDSQNQIACFVEFSKGTELEEIAHALAVPLDTLKRWRHEGKWDLLAPKLPVAPLPRSMTEQRRAAEKIQANRDKNLLIAQRLQEDLIAVLDKLRSGELVTIKVFANGSQVELAPSLRDRCDLALYAKNVADISYRALGDAPEAKNAGGGESLPNVGQITINLPPLVAAPRQERPRPGFDVDLEPVTAPEPVLLVTAGDAPASGVADAGDADTAT